MFDFKCGQEYAAYLIGNENVCVFENDKSAQWQERYDEPSVASSVYLTVGLNKDKGHISCIHNYSLLKDHGTHYEVLKDRLCAAINGAFSEFLPELYSIEIPDITWEEIEPYFVLILESYCTRWCTKWSGSDCNGIKNRLIADLCEDLVHEWHIFCHDGFGTYLERNVGELESVIKEILNNRKDKSCLKR